MPLFFVVPVVLLVPVLFYAFFLFDRLVQAEYQEHREAWEADGRPAGFFWRPPESRFLACGPARTRLALALLFRTPGWIAASPALTTQLRWHRWLVLVWNVGILVAFVFFLRSR